MTKFLVTEEIAETMELVHAEYPTMAKAQTAYAKKQGFAQVHVCKHDGTPPSPCEIVAQKGFRVADKVAEPIEEPITEEPIEKPPVDKQPVEEVGDGITKNDTLRVP